MKPRTLLQALNVAERLKDTTRHCGFQKSMS